MFKKTQPGVGMNSHTANDNVRPDLTTIRQRKPFAVGKGGGRRLIKEGWTEAAGTPCLIPQKI